MEARAVHSHFDTWNWRSPLSRPHSPEPRRPHPPSGVTLGPLIHQVLFGHSLHAGPFGCRSCSTRGSCFAASLFSTSSRRVGRQRVRPLPGIGTPGTPPPEDVVA